MLIDARRKTFLPAVDLTKTSREHRGVYAPLMRKLWGALVLVLALSGCGAATEGNPATPSATPPTKPATYYGETASALAARIPGCEDVKAGDIGNGAATGLASTASCTLAGRTIDIDSWATSDAQVSLMPLLKADKSELYYANGMGWTAFVRRDGQLQMQLTNDAAGLTAAAMNSSGPAADLPGEQEAATAIATGLGGTVEHIQP